VYVVGDDEDARTFLQHDRVIRTGAVRTRPVQPTPTMACVRSFVPRVITIRDGRWSQKRSMSNNVGVRQPAKYNTKKRRANMRGHIHVRGIDRTCPLPSLNRRDRRSIKRYGFDVFTSGVSFSSAYPFGHPSKHGLSRGVK